MGSPAVGESREAAIWARLMRTPKARLTAEAAEYLLSVGFGDSDRRRMARLAQKSESGELTGEERAEFDSYLHIGNWLAVMQSKARVALGGKSRDGRLS